jgi:hypothetical protein
METGETYFSVGGVVGRGAGSSKNLTNYKSGTVTVAGSFTASLNKKYGWTSIGGVAGTFSSGAHSNIHNYATVNISSSIPNASWNEEPFPFAGVIGYVTNNLSNISNNGDLNVSCASKSDEPLRISGVYGRGSNEGPNTYDNIVNKGKITVSATSTNDHIYVAGINAYNTKSTYSNVINEGDIVIEEKSATSDSYYVGGLFTAPTATVTTKENLVNKGNITVKGKAGKAGLVCVGGISAAGAAPVTCGTNIGNITVVRPEGATSTECIGGAIAKPTANISGVEVHCDILAIGCSNVGMIKGEGRIVDVEGVATPLLATNCKLGVRIATVMAPDASGDPAPYWNDVTAENYYDYIYGTVVDWTGVDNYDGCSFLSVKPTL